MSRSVKNKKPVGYDYWTKRLGNNGCQGYGPEVKKRTHKLERLRDKKIERESEE